VSVTPNQTVIYGSASMPEADGLTVGGVVDFTKRVSFYDLPSSMTMDVVSSSASDVATKIQITGRDSTGTIITPAAVTLTGNAVITYGGTSFQRLLAGVITGGSIAGLTNPGGTPAVGDVAAMGHTRFIPGHTAQVGSTNTTGTTPPLFKLQAGDGVQLATAPPRAARLSRLLDFTVYPATGAAPRADQRRASSGNVSRWGPRGQAPFLVRSKDLRRSSCMPRFLWSGIWKRFHMFT
jgi:hypothetical protein